MSVHPFGDRAWTDSEGRFSVCPHGRDTWDAPPHRLIFQDDRNHQALAMEVDDMTSLPLQATLSPCSPVSGRVVDLKGSPVTAASVQLILPLPHSLSRLGPKVLTNAEGYYHLPALPPRNAYLLTVEASGFSSKRNHRISFTQDPSQAVTLEPIRLARADQTSTGRVIDHRGAPVPNLYVGVSSDSHKESIQQPRRGSFTDAKGFFTITRICQASAKFQAGDSRFPPGSGGLIAQGGDKDLLIRIKPPTPKRASTARGLGTAQPKRRQPKQPKQNRKREARRNRSR